MSLTNTVLILEHGIVAVKIDSSDPAHCCIALQHMPLNVTAYLNKFGWEEGVQKMKSCFLVKLFFSLI
jgi:hypothetical protein